MTQPVPPGPPYWREYPQLARVLYFIAFIFLLLYTIKVGSGTSGLPDWLGWAGLTAIAAGLVVA